ncbi:hypothetical protein [uncultured Tateyamaria sp.]|uniref:capsular polysaccharide export protein, LipB/KpsS family n=1 Tax=uncultured Tateyamaria sp. TaxID=455651 RepID=UPI00262F108E|nr:hypothetical protein [uncultured Tateyamaria sp.]
MTSRKSVAQSRKVVLPSSSKVTHHNVGAPHIAVMVRSVAAQAKDRPVVIKAHPSFNPKAEQQMIHALQAEGLKLIPTHANIHDILAACSVTVTFNSAVALEGFLHHKPAILFGKSDFHHVCETVIDPEKFNDHLTRALSAQHDYQHFLYWYFSTFLPRPGPSRFGHGYPSGLHQSGFFSGPAGLARWSLGIRTCIQCDQRGEDTNPLFERSSRCPISSHSRNPQILIQKLGV